MTPSRIGLVLTAVALLFVAATTMRAETARLRADTQRRQADLISLRRQEWALHMELARMRASTRIRKRVHRMGLRVGADFDRMMQPAFELEPVAGLP